MSESFIIRGGKSLEGEIEVSGSKNAALAILASTLLMAGPVTVRRVPAIRDVHHILEILRELGAEVRREGDAVYLDTTAVSRYDPNPELVRHLRGSVLLAGPLLARFGKVRMPYPGGDAIGARSLDTHFEAFRALGVEIRETVDHFLEIDAPKGLKGGKVVLDEPSVTATENIMMAAVGAKGETVVRLAATEPHVQDLAAFLNRAGAHIEGAGTPTLRINGVNGLECGSGIEHVLIPDSDEAMSLMALAAATRSTVLIKNLNPEFIEAGILRLRSVGANLDVGNDYVLVKRPVALYRAAKFKIGPYPNLMSDQLPPFAVLATQAHGTSLIHEWMYEGRLGYINELIKMGANAVIMDPHRALIIGPTPLRGAELRSLDIRSGMTTIIAGLVAEGETVINDVGIIDRGYERIEERLRILGADIERRVI